MFFVFSTTNNEGEAAHHHLTLGHYFLPLTGRVLQKTHGILGDTFIANFKVQELPVDRRLPASAILPPHRTTWTSFTSIAKHARMRATITIAVINAGHLTILGSVIRIDRCCCSRNLWPG
jgi:hypothetical protein